MPSVRILSVGNMYPPQSLGGYELVWHSWVHAAEAQGHEVRVLTTDLALDGERFSGAELSADVRRDLRWYWHDYGWPRPSVRERWAVERHNARVFERELAGFRPDAVTWWAMAGMSLSPFERVRRARVPSVAVVYDYWLEYGPEVDAWLRPFLRRPRAARLLASLTGQITSVDLVSGVSYVFGSEYVQRRGQAAWPELGPSEVVLRAPPDVELFSPRPEREWEGRLLYAGRVNREKGVDLAILALADLPADVTLVVDGPGSPDDVAALGSLASGHGLDGRVTFRHSERAELPQRFADADAILFPVRWHEPYGLVPIEAMAAGTPVVATGRGGSGEYLEDRGNALVFDPDDGPGALAGRVRELAGDPELRARLRAGGLRTVRALEEERFNDRVLATVERAVTGG